MAADGQQSDASALIADALDGIGQGVLIVGPDGCMVRGNRRFLELYGVDETTIRPGIPFADHLRMMVERGVRPTALQPLWNVAGFALGAATALIGPKAAMACTAAIETEIDLHYGEQLDQLGDADPELSAAIGEFRAEEREHRDTAIKAGAEQAPGYPLLSGAIRLGCRIAIKLSRHI